MGLVGDAHSLLVVGWSRGVPSVKIRVAIGVPARGAGGVEGRVRAGRVVRSGGLTKSSVLTGSSGESC